MSQEFNVRIKGKVDTQVNFEASQEIYLDGELLTVRMTNGETRFKVGDGVSTFNQLKYQDEPIRELVSNIPDVSQFVIATDDGEISSEIPTTFDGHVLEEFILKEEVVDNLTTDKNNIPLSANQGKILDEKKLNVSGGTLTGALIAQSNNNYMTGQVRNIYLSTEAPTNDVGSDGDIWIVYGG